VPFNGMPSNRAGPVTVKLPLRARSCSDDAVSCLFGISTLDRTSRMSADTSNVTGKGLILRVTGNDKVPDVRARPSAIAIKTGHTRGVLNGWHVL